jgi:hypothetical protein
MSEDKQVKTDQTISQVQPRRQDVIHKRGNLSSEPPGVGVPPTAQFAPETPPAAAEPPPASTPPPQQQGESGGSGD